MKTEILENEQYFKPVTIQLTLETKEECHDLILLLTAEEDFEEYEDKSAICFKLTAIVNQLKSKL